MQGTDGRAALGFARLTRRIHGSLPRPLAAVLPITFIGYAIINGSSFLLDMAILTALGRYWHIPYGLLFSIGYGLACVYSFILNRWLNFREHGDLGKQTSKYAFVIASNYVIWILGFGTLLGILGVQLQVARVTAACIEGIYIYLLLRFWVFPKQRGAVTLGAPTEAVAPVAAATVVQQDAAAARS